MGLQQIWEANKGFWTLETEWRREILWWESLQSKKGPNICLLEKWNATTPSGPSSSGFCKAQSWIVNVSVQRSNVVVVNLFTSLIASLWSGQWDDFFECPITHTCIYGVAIDNSCSRLHLGWVKVEEFGALIHSCFGLIFKFEAEFKLELLVIVYQVQVRAWALRIFPGNGDQH
jgi:hypothetical protein